MYILRIKMLLNNENLLETDIPIKKAIFANKQEIEQQNMLIMYSALIVLRVDS